MFALYSMNRSVFALVLTLGLISPFSQIVGFFLVSFVYGTNLTTAHNCLYGDLPIVVSVQLNLGNIRPWKDQLRSLVQ